MHMDTETCTWQVLYLLSALKQCSLSLTLLGFTLPAAPLNFGCCCGGCVNGFLLCIVPADACSEHTAIFGNSAIVVLSDDEGLR